MMKPDSHEIFGRRKSRNVGLGVVLGAFVLIVFAVTVVKLTQGVSMEGYDHQTRNSLLPLAEEQIMFGRISKNGRMALTLTGVVAVMVGLSFAAVPLYDLFCRVTGYGGTTSVAQAGSDVHITDQEITIRFDANVSPDIPWEFHPVERTMKIKIGETGLAFYEATNKSDEPVAGAASYNVAPYSAGGYFSKIACFCFELQVLQPGETIEMPVTFYVDPEILEDRETKDVNYITLSYTMHRTDLPEAEMGSLAVEPEIEVVGLGSDQIAVQ